MTNAKRITTMALLTALALIIFTVEAQLPPLLPLPGFKLGLANIITVYAMFRLGPGDTLLILFARIFLGAAFAGAMSSLLFSLAGGGLCYLAMLGLRRILTERQLWVCGILGAVCHNLGQMAAAVFVYRTTAVLVYLPALLLAGMVTGAFTGLSAQSLLKRLKDGQQGKPENRRY